MAERIKVKTLKTFGEFEKLIPIQRAVWRHDDLDLTPVHQFCVSSRMGAILLGAYIGPDLTGFVYSFPAVFQGKNCQHSHLLAVLPEFQGRGIGKILKWAQREEALRRGVQFVTWTFDPLQARNANLNLQALGGISRTYIPNFYGLTASLCLGPGIPTDRLLIEWPIREARVRRRARGGTKKEEMDSGGFPKALERRTKGEGTDLRPGGPRLDLRNETLLVEAPPVVREMRGRPEAIAEWQAKLRRTMTHYFGRGYRADHFVYGERCFYVLRKIPPGTGK